MTEMMTITIQWLNMDLPSFEFGKSWPISHIRHEIAIVLGKQDVPDEYDLFVDRPGLPPLKVTTLWSGCSMHEII